MSRLLFAGAAAATVAAQTTDLAGHYVSDMEYEHFKLVNELRAEGYTCYSGVTYAPNPTAMQFDCRLWRAARLHSIDMVENGYFSHTSLDGREFTDRAEAQGIKAAGENLCYQYGMTAQKVLECWRDSRSGHCDGMMNPDRVLFGAGFYDSPLNNWSKATQLYAGETWVSSIDDTSCFSDVKAGLTPSPTPGPTPAPTPPPVPTPEPTRFPTWDPIINIVCNPQSDCLMDADCYSKYGPICGTYGSDMCGLASAKSGDPETEHCLEEELSLDDSVYACAPHPDDVNSSWLKCFGAAYWMESQCTEGGEKQGVQCLWMLTPREAYVNLMMQPDFFG